MAGALPGEARRLIRALRTYSEEVQKPVAGAESVQQAMSSLVESMGEYAEWATKSGFPDPFEQYLGDPQRVRITHGQEQGRKAPQSFMIKAEYVVRVRDEGAIRELTAPGSDAEACRMDDDTPAQLIDCVDALYGRDHWNPEQYPHGALELISHGWSCQGTALPRVGRGSDKG